MKRDIFTHTTLVLLLSLAFCQIGYGQYWEQGRLHALEHSDFPDFTNYCDVIPPMDGETFNFMTQIMQKAGMGWVDSRWHCEPMDPVFEGQGTLCNDDIFWYCEGNHMETHTLRWATDVALADSFENPNDATTDSEWWVKVWSGTLRQYGATSSISDSLLHMYQIVSVFDATVGWHDEYLLFVTTDETPPAQGTTRTFDAHFCARGTQGNRSDEIFQAFKERYRNQEGLPEHILITVFNPIGGPEIPTIGSSRQGGGR